MAVRSDSPDTCSAARPARALTPTISSGTVIGAPPGAETAFPPFESTRPPTRQVPLGTNRRRLRNPAGLPAALHPIGADIPLAHQAWRALAMKILGFSPPWPAVLSTGLLLLSHEAAFATPSANGAFIATRTFNDCPISTVTTVNNYPASVSITDVMDTLCVGFANLHSWSFSSDGGTSAAVFNNNSNFHFGADFVIDGPGEGEGGLRISPWYGQFVDGRFMANATTGEIACFGGALPFYSFTVNHGITYTRGTTIRFEETYDGHDNTSINPATIQYRVIYNGNTYNSPVLPFGEQNPNECEHGLFG